MFVLILIALSPTASALSIVIKLPSGDVLALETASSDSIQQIKQRIQDELGFSPETQRLVFAGKPLEDGRTLGDYNIQAESVLHLLLPRTVASIPSLGSYGFVVLSALLAGLGLVAARRPAG